MRIFTPFLFLFTISFQAFILGSFNSISSSLENKIKYVCSIYNSTVNSSKHQINGPMLWDDELEKAHQENSHLKQSHIQERRFYTVIIIASIIALLGLIYMVYSIYNEKKHYKNLYLQSLKKQEIKKHYEIELKNDDHIYELSDINPLIVENILSAIEVFEKEKKYLVKNASLINMAKECGTNTTYLSKVINHYKKQSFTSYLNELRLNYAIELWNNNPKLRHKSIQGIADMTGFNTAQSFSKKFQERYKIPPTHFLKNLNQKNKAS
ncbi:helix-turn-helix domain-containing protein [Chryseobacterium jejuense]|uniref:helix-turn-helix domain-containing protein n=1 Tax=Chryseobacterium jejuense TaxID=445960 RepID=UPI001AE6ABD4|nr:helix-turn-helix domain-containing protein [Chryseobacterium jejuense]MBP2619246.1 AraC-like DNA-binding protein [Chryseobacterium jejuense]